MGGTPIHIQTGTLASMHTGSGNATATDLVNTLNYGIQAIGMRSVELPGDQLGYWGLGITNSQWANFATALAANDPVGTGKRAIGLYDRHGYSTALASGLGGYLQGFVEQVNWSDLQATNGGALNTSQIDTAISNAISAGYGWNIIVRVMLGESAPSWAMTLDGPAITNSASTPVGRWWTANYTAAVANLFQQLQAKYDDPGNLIVQFELGQTMTAYCEPLMKVDYWNDTSATYTKVINAGWTEAKEIAAQQGDQVMGASTFTYTPCAMSFNPTQLFVSGGPPGQTSTTDMSTVINSMVTNFSVGLGVLENNSLRANGSTWTVGGYNTLNDAHGSTYTTMYRLMGSLGILALGPDVVTHDVSLANQSTSGQSLAISTGTPSYYSASVHDTSRSSETLAQSLVAVEYASLADESTSQEQFGFGFHGEFIADPGPAALGSLQDFIIGVPRP